MTFISVCFFGRVNLKQLEKKKALENPKGKLSRKIFEILHDDDVVAFLVLFEQILIKLVAPHSEYFTNYDAFCSHTFDLCVLASGQ